MFSSSAIEQQGFSLLELLVVLVIIGFMVVLIPPRLSGVMLSMQTKASAREIISALRESRSSAIKFQKEQVFKLDLKNKTFSTDHSKVKMLPDKIQLDLFTARSEQISEYVGTIRFFPDGSSTGGRIKLTREKQYLFIDISWLTGKVALLKNINPDQWKTDTGGFITKSNPNS